MHQFLKCISGIKFYVFRTVPLSIIRSFSLYTQQWHVSYRFAVCTVKTPDDGQRNCPKYVDVYSKNKFEKLVHLAGFIIRVNTILCCKYMIILLHVSVCAEKHEGMVIKGKSIYSSFCHRCPIIMLKYSFVHCNINSNRRHWDNPDR